MAGSAESPTSAAPARRGRPPGRPRLRAIPAALGLALLGALAPAIPAAAATSARGASGLTALQRERVATVPQAVIGNLSSAVG